MIVNDALLTQLSTITDEADKQRVVDTLYPNGTQVNAVKGAIETKADTQGSNVIPNPNPWITNYIWTVITTGFVLILIAAFLAIGWAVLFHLPNPPLPAETLLTIFTTILGFLGGILVPSPVQQNAKS